MDKGKYHVCPVACAWGLDNILRRLIQNPEKILASYVKNGMTALDVGCGPGFFTLAMAELVGESGRVIAADLQAEMLQKIDRKIKGTHLENRITLHRCEEDRINLTEKVDFALAFYMVHEVPDGKGFFKEMFEILKPSGQFLVVEPKMFHVSETEFQNTINDAVSAGFEAAKGPRMLLSMTMALRRP
jgi:ubiquinone/menaquinone biosynthesis C-methylase UbiE